MARVAESIAAELKSIPQAFERAVSAHARRKALTGDGGLGRSFTYAETQEAVRFLSNGLRGAQYREISVVGLLSENRPEWVIAYLAILAAGKTVVPIDVTLKPKEIGYVLVHAGLELVFCSERQETLLRDLDHRLTVFSFDENSDDCWSRLNRTGESPEPVACEETAVLIYTSGTTGAPKAVELTHQNLLSNVSGIAMSLKFDEADVFLSVLPLHHTFEATCGFLTPILSGATIVYARSLKSREILEDIQRTGVTVMCGVPLLYEKMYQSLIRGLRAAPIGRRIMFSLLLPLSSTGWRMGKRWGRSLFAKLRSKTGMDSVRLFVSGGAALPPPICRFFNLIGFELLQGYGLTECSPVLSAHRPGDIKFGSVGPPLNNVEIRIVDPDANGIGEIVARGPNITPGYRGNPEQTAALIRDGWLYTGDLGHLNDGHLWITGRAKSLIVSAAGKNIYPEELEERLVESEFVLEAVVFGRQKEGKQGEEVRAVIVPDLEQFRDKFGFDQSNPEMGRIGSVMKAEVDGVNRHVAGYKRISSYDIQLQELEKTSTKKVKRFLYS